jgi:dolichyl-phosphate beta-glucosyltransferase
MNDSARAMARMEQVGPAAPLPLSVVIPAYNEEARLPKTLFRVASYLRSRGIHAEILVVDDGSTDGTAAAAEQFLGSTMGRVLRNGTNRGKGFSVRRGVLEARGERVLMTDADLSTPIEELETLERALDLDHAAVAMGSRNLHGSRIEVSQGPLRRLMGRVFNGLIRSLAGLPFRDTQCGFKLMDRSRTLPLFRLMVVDRFAFDVELAFLCRRQGLDVREVAVSWSDTPGSKVHMLKDPPQMLRDVIRIRWRAAADHYPMPGGGLSLAPSTRKAAGRAPVRSNNTLKKRPLISDLEGENERGAR